MNKTKLSSIFRIGAIVAVVALLLAGFVTLVSRRPSPADQVWDEKATVGNLDAKNYFIIYSDIACPYCIAFENAIVENEDAFLKYIESNDILVEVRVSDFLYEYGQTNPVSSRFSAVATYCARDEGRFWDYYNLAVATVWRDYYAPLGKNGYEKLESLGIDYWEDLGRSIGLSDEFVACVENGDPLPEIVENAAKTVKRIDGMPYFKFNSTVFNQGFSLSWGWQEVLMFFDAGLKS